MSNPDSIKIRHRQLHLVGSRFHSLACMSAFDYFVTSPIILSKISYCPSGARIFPLLDIMKFIKKQNLSFRSRHEEIHSGTNTHLEWILNKGHFLELVHQLVKFKSDLREHLLRVKLGKHIISCLSPIVQSEFMNILGQCVEKKMINCVKDKYFVITYYRIPEILKRIEWASPCHMSRLKEIM